MHQTSPKSAARPLTQHLLAYLLLFIAVWGMSSTRWPLSDHTFWQQLGLSQVMRWPEEWRAYGLPGMIAQIILPWQVQNIEILHWVYLWLSACLVYAIGRRFMPAYPSFALLLALLIAGGTPAAIDQWASPFVNYMVLGRFFGLLALALALWMVEAQMPCWWLGLLLLAALVLLAIQTFEALIPPLAALPVLFLLRPAWRRWRTLIIVLVWWASVAFITLEFFRAFPVSQMERYGSQSPGLENLLLRFATFYQTAFSVPIDLQDANYLLPALLLALVVGAGLVAWRRIANDELPSAGQLGLALLLGVWWIAVSGFAFYQPANNLLPTYSRSHILSMPGVLLVVLALLALLARLLAKPLNLRPVALVGGALVVAVAAQFHWVAESRWSNDLRSNGDLVRLLAALVPNAQPDTLIYYACENGLYPKNRGARSLANLSPFLYGQGSNIYIGVAGEVMDENPVKWRNLVPRADGVDFDETWIIGDEQRYRYEQVVAIDCEGYRLFVAANFPTAYLPSNADVSAYHPFPRLRDGWLTPQALAYTGR
ncbi:MAG: hypothetical protein NZ750_14025 [Anaerolineae bacterium]|nr:hypothetical protein [Anaerolineae bacterium]MDW8171330.1 hypothetical protein [Anaerolineae bacterium]